MSQKPVSDLLALLLLVATVSLGLANADKGLAIPAAASTDSKSAKVSEFSTAKELRSLTELRSLIDQEGKPFSFARLSKKTVLVNFIFTSCPVQCPKQTQALIALQRALPASQRPRVRFVSVTIDPERDSASVLKRYATAMGADLSDWSFVTGSESELNWLNHYYSVGVKAIAEDQYDHQMGAYLLDAQGRVMQRYTGDIDKPRLLREIGELDARNK